MKPEIDTIISIICEEIIKTAKQNCVSTHSEHISYIHFYEEKSTNKENNYKIEIIENKIIVTRFKIKQYYIDEFGRFNHYIPISQEHLSNPNSIEKTIQKIIEDNLMQMV